jgi:hypothetical protein
MHFLNNEEKLVVAASANVYGAWGVTAE